MSKLNISKKNIQENVLENLENIKKSIATENPLGIGFMEKIIN